MILFGLIEFALIILVVWFIITQVAVPVCMGVPLFPFFRARRTRKLLVEIASAEQRRYELNLLALRAKQEAELLAQEAAIPAAPSSEGKPQCPPAPSPPSSEAP